MSSKRKRSDSNAPPSTAAHMLASLNAISSSSSLKPSTKSSATYSTSFSSPSSSAPKPKKARPTQEKRPARFKSSCPKNILDRVDRVLSQRFFMVDRQRQDGEVKETFSVLGSTGNVYIVTIADLPSCTCPDALKGNHCKHILFIFLKVLHVPVSSHTWYQKGLLTEELEDIFARAPVAPNHLSNPHLQKVFSQVTGKAPKGEGTSDSTSKRNRKMPTEDDDCPICYESMHGSQEKDLVFCENSCQKPLHKECFNQWKQVQRAKGAHVTCVWCRSKWQESGPSGGGSHSTGATISEGYLNLGVAAGLSPERDTSTYHHGFGNGYSSRHYGRRARYNQCAFSDDYD